MNKQTHEYDYQKGEKKTDYSSTCVFFIHTLCFLMYICSMSLLFDYMCMRSPFIPWAREEKERKRDRRSIVGVPSSKALPGFRITAHPCVYVPAAFGVLAC